MTFNFAMSGHRGVVPKFFTFPVENDNGAFALCALIIGFMERQKPIDYDLGEVLSLMNPNKS